MAAARAQIRRPLDSRAQVTISVVDTNGAVLGIVRSPDAPIFGIDVSLQKARTATFFSGRLRRRASCSADPDRRRRRLRRRRRAPSSTIPTALTGQNAFSDRANGNVSRPYFPDGELGRPPGAFSRPIAEFNPFSTGLQSALITPTVLAACRLRPRPAAGRRAAAPAPAIATPGRLANGIQIFPGSVPIYRGNTLVGGIGVSGDGIDQDDMISFLGLHNGGVRLGTVGNAPAAIRADQIVVPVAGEQRRPAALRQLPVQPVPRHQRAECLPGQMTVAAALLALLAGTAQPPEQPPPAGGPHPARADAVRGIADPGPAPARASSSTTFPTRSTRSIPARSARRRPRPSRPSISPIPDRWRLAETLGLVHPRWSDPYNQNTLKGDRPICDPADESEARRRSLGCRARTACLGLTGPDWFFVASAISDTVIEPRTFPIPVGVQTTAAAGQHRRVRRQSQPRPRRRPSSPAVALIKGNTAFVPPHIEYRLTLAFNANYVDVGERRVLIVQPSPRHPPLRRLRSASRKPSSTITSATSRTGSTSTASASASSRSSSISAASCSRTSSSASACSAIATTTASSTISRRSGGSRRTPIRGLNNILQTPAPTTGSSTPTSSARISRSSA